MSGRLKALISFAVVIGLSLILFGLFGSAGKDDAFAPQEEFKLDPWLAIKLGPLDFSLNKAVLYLVLATGMTMAAMLYIANRMQGRPNRVQTAVETAYLFMRDSITYNNMDDKMARKWFGFVGTLFMFIWFSNMIGYVPLPTNTAHTVDVGVKLPVFALYSATANISVTLVLTLMVWFAYHFEGVRDQGPIGYLKSWVPAGVTGPAVVPIFAIEVISHFVRIISLSVRLFANILAGHLLILFMGGGLVVLLGLAALAPFTMPLAIGFFIFEVILIATLQAFIFATLTAIYLGDAVAAHH